MARMTKKEAAKRIAQIVEQAGAPLAEAEELSIEHDLPFYYRIENDEKVALEGGESIEPPDHQEWRGSGC